MWECVSEQVKIKPPDGAAKNRQDLLDIVARHGWTWQVMFAGHGPVVVVTIPQCNGFIELGVPPRADDDHSQCIQNLYGLAAHFLWVSGVGGTA